MDLGSKIIYEIVKGYQKLGFIDSKQIRMTNDSIILYNTYTLTSNRIDIKLENAVVSFTLGEVFKVSNREKSVFIELHNRKYFELKTLYVDIFSDILKELLYSYEHFLFALTNYNYYNSFSLAEINVEKFFSSKHLQKKLEVLSYIKTQQYSKAESILNTMTDYSSVDVLYYSSLLKQSRAKFNKEPRLFYDALDPLLNAYKSIKSRILFTSLKEAYLQYRDNFLAFPLNSRKFLFITNGFYDFSGKSFTVLLDKVILSEDDPLKNFVTVGDIKLPDEIEFPIGHPKNNTMYVLHPYNNSYYIPVETHESILFKDRADEFKNLVQALGAVEINYTKINKVLKEQQRKEDINASVDVTQKVYNVNVSVNYSENEKQSNSEEIGYYSKQRFNPKVIPHLPEKLVWYNKETTWQRLYAQRSNGNNLLEHIEEINSKSLRNVSYEEIIEINAQLKILLFNAKANIKNNFQIEISEEEEEAQKIVVQFAPIEELTSVLNNDRINKVEEVKVQLFNVLDYESISDYHDNQYLEQLLGKSHTNEYLLQFKLEREKEKIVGGNIRIPLIVEKNLYLDMVYVEGGTFTMGTDDVEVLAKSPISKKKVVSVESFYISKLVVDRRLGDLLFHDISTPYSTTLPCPFIINEKNDDVELFFKILNERCSELKFEHLTVEEWEYAAKGGKYSKGYLYSGSDTLEEVGVYNCKSIYPVGTCKYNELGLFDMSGNMYEFVVNSDNKVTFKGGKYSSSEIFCRPSFTHHNNDIIADIAKEGFALRLKLSIDEAEKLIGYDDNFKLVEFKNN